MITWHQGKHVMACLEIVNFGIFTNLFLFFSVQNFMYPIMYQHIKKREAEHESRLLLKPLPPRWHPVVKLLYTTYNDFIPYALNKEIAKSAKKDYKYLNSIDIINHRNQVQPAIHKVLQSLSICIDKYTDPMQEFMDSPSYTDIYQDAELDKKDIGAVLSACHDFYYKAINRPDKMNEQSL